MTPEARLHARAARHRPATTFTVLLPVTRPPRTLSYAVRSVLAQSLTDFELCIILDGAPLRTRAVAMLWELRDRRARVFAFPKGKRHGESHRAAVLAGSRARFVAQIGDDDLWFPCHLARLEELLQTADFAAVSQCRIMPDGQPCMPPVGNLADPSCRSRMLTHAWNFFGPTEAGYRLAAYRQLPVGWSPAPEGLPTDLFMWRKFLSHPGLSFATTHWATSLKFGASDWRRVSSRRLVRTVRHFSSRLGQPSLHAAMQDCVGGVSD